MSRFPVLRPILFPSALFLRSSDQSVAKRGLQTSRVPGRSPSNPMQSTIRCGRKEESVAQAAPRGTWNRNVIIIAGLRIRMFFRSSNLLTYYSTRIDALGTMAWPQERFPYYANARRSPCSVGCSSSPRLASRSGSLNRRIG